MKRSRSSSDSSSTESSSSSSSSSPLSVPTTAVPSSSPSLPAPPSAISSTSSPPSAPSPLEAKLFKKKSGAYRELAAGIVADLGLQPGEDATRGHRLLRNLGRLYRLHERTHDLELTDRADPDCVVDTLHMALSLAAHIERRPDERDKDAHELAQLLTEDAEQETKS